jgi:hypothetical protein
MAVYLLLALAAFVHLSLHWPLVGDSTLLHYSVFLLRHGFAPYAQLVDINLPGTYAFEWLVVRLFGYGALPWRLFDFSLLLALGGASLALLRAHDAQWPRASRWLAALWVMTVFALLHGRDGFTDLGQRDLLMTALLGVAYVFFFRALVAQARHASAWLLGCGLAIGVAATIKPTALLLLPVLLVLYIPDRRDGARSARRSSMAAFAGAALPVAAMLIYLLREHALGAFVRIMTKLVPLHSSLFRHSAVALLGGTISSVMLPFVVLGLPALLYSRPWRFARGRAVLAGFAFGVLSFVVQGRGYPYHRYPSEFFLLLLYARAFAAAGRAGIERSPLHRRLWKTSAGLAVLFSVAAILPNALASMHRLTPAQDSFDTALASALQQRGGATLSGHVQCVDMAGGCVTTLLRLRLVQSTGFLYDCYALAPVRPEFVAEQQRYRQAWLAALRRTQPALLIVSSDECGPADFRYTKLTRWPAFADLLQKDYRLADQWSPQRTENWYGHPALPYGFRLYERKPTGLAPCAPEASTPTYRAERGNGPTAGG